jgi:hypothetical protein
MKQFGKLRALGAQGRWSEVMAGLALLDRKASTEVGVALLHLEAMLNLHMDAAVWVDGIHTREFPSEMILRFGEILEAAREYSAVALLVLNAFEQGHNDPVLLAMANRVMLGRKLTPDLTRRLEEALAKVEPYPFIRFPEGELVPRQNTACPSFSVEPAALVEPVYSTPDLESWRGIFLDMGRKIDRALTVAVPPPQGLLRNVFFDRLGNIWRADGAPVLNFGRYVEFVVEVVKRRLGAGRIPTFERVVTPIKPSQGYYHWLAECVPSLAWLLSPDVPHDIKVAIPRGAQSFKFDTLALAGFPADRIVAYDGDYAYARELYFSPEIYRGIESWGAVAPLYDALAEAARRQATGPGPARLYVSRRDSTRRSMTNEERLEDHLAAKGFTIAVLSNLSLAEKIALFQSAKVVVGAHGAGLTHVLFGTPGSVLLDIIPVSPIVYRGRRHFLKLSRIRRVHYVPCFVAVNSAGGDWEVDIGGVDRALAMALSLSDC